MSTSPSTDEALDFQRRWALVAERERDAARRATLEQKLDEVERLMLSIDDFGWREALDDDEPVRARWVRLRQRLASQPASI
jgi:hypothetical protein